MPSPSPFSHSSLPNSHLSSVFPAFPHLNALTPASNHHLATCSHPSAHNSCCSQQSHLGFSLCQPLTPPCCVKILPLLPHNPHLFTSSPTHPRLTPSVPLPLYQDSCITVHVYIRHIQCKQKRQKHVSSL